MATTERAERRRPRFRPSVFVLMVVVALVAVLLGWYVNAVRSQQAAVAAIKEAGGSVSYDWDWGNYDPNIVSYQGKWRAPKWLASRIGPDYVANVVHVNLVPGRGNKKKADDLTLEFVARLTHVESLWLNGTSVTDAGMVHVNGLTRLNNLTIGCLGVTDAGLARLKGLANLKTLDLDGSKVTDAGVLALEEALPRVQVLREDDVAVSRNSKRATNDSSFATSLPVRVAAPILRNRAKTMVTRGDMPELVASIDALCSLESDNVVDLIKLVQARGECLAILEPSFSPKLSASERQALLKRCEDRGIDALTLAVDKGYNNIRRLDGDSWESLMVGNLRKHPGYARLIQIMKSRRKGANK
ncbi:hypothetical protein OJF2_44500 [Aquisphaera giovannonii]|uniref:Leucine Rich repeats (2 copies) n=1 Tax=Aquisphaera giovannonii TaxID=406548 RepID=A0A5B9W5L5_9BACT|nr:hypothetical protein [Aquisphaera giovannonii]QEH35893.1 hypothetical protein OJF2_44500 [Aquisphaera giovannonii]